MTIATPDATPAVLLWWRRWQIQWGPTLRMVLLIGLGEMLVIKVLNGGISYYVNSIYIRLILAAGIGMIVTGYAAGVESFILRRAVPHHDHYDHDHDHDHTHDRAGHAHDGHDHQHATGRLEVLGYAALLIPLLLGLLVPSRPLGSAAVAARTNGPAAGPAAGSKLKSLTGADASTDRWTLLDWYVASTQLADPHALDGKPVSVIGFVSQGDSGLGPGYLTIARFVVVCCIADGNAVTLPVRWGSAPPRDTWVRVTGTIAMGGVGGRPVPFVAATSVAPIPQPDQPYIYSGLVLDELTGSPPEG